MENEDEEIKKIEQKKMKEWEERASYPKEPIVLNDNNMDKTINQYDIVVIDCWAAWCAPCKMIAPIVKNLARKYNGKIVFGKLDVDENRTTALNFRIDIIPVLLVFKKGKLVDKMMGVMPEAIVEEKIKQYLE